MERKLIIANGSQEVSIDALSQAIPTQGSMQASEAVPQDPAAKGADIIKRPLPGALLPVSGPYVLRSDGSTVPGTLEQRPARAWGDTSPAHVPAQTGATSELSGTHAPQPSIPRQRSTELGMVAATIGDVTKFRDDYARHMAAHRAGEQTYLWQRLRHRLGQADMAPVISWSEATDGTRGVKEVSAMWQFAVEEQRMPNGRILSPTTTKVIATTALEGLISRAERRTGDIWGDADKVLVADDAGKKAKVKSPTLFGVEGTPTRSIFGARRYSYEAGSVSDAIGSAILDTRKVQVEADVRKVDSESDSQMPETLVSAVVVRPELSQPGSKLTELKPLDILKGAIALITRPGTKPPTQIPVDAVRHIIDNHEIASYNPHQQNRLLSPQYSELEVAMQFMRPSQQTPAEQ